MRGSPLWRALTAFLLILTFFGYPLWRMTLAEERPSAPATVAPAPPPAAPSQEVHLELTSTAPPKAFQVTHLGQTVWEESSPAAKMEHRLELKYPEEGVDLRFKIEWPEGALCAMRVVLTDPDGQEHEKSVWGEGSVDEVLSFP